MTSHHKPQDPLAVSGIGTKKHYIFRLRYHLTIFILIFIFYLFFLARGVFLSTKQLWMMCFTGALIIFSIFLISHTSANKQKYKQSTLPALIGLIAFLFVKLFMSLIYGLNPLTSILIGIGVALIIYAIMSILSKR